MPFCLALNRESPNLCLCQPHLSLCPFNPLSLSSQEYVPFQPYVEGPLLVVLHIAKTLPRYIAAAAVTPGSSTAATAGSTAAAGGPSPLVAMFGGLSAGDAQAASAAIADPAKLGKLKRDLYFRCRWRVSGLMVLGSGV